MAARDDAAAAAILAVAVGHRKRKRDWTLPLFGARLSRHSRRGAVWERKRREVFQRDGWRCVRCGRAGRLECDHIRPLRAGGSEDMVNLRALCRDCHIKRHRPKLSPAVLEWRKLLADLS